MSTEQTLVEQDDNNIATIHQDRQGIAPLAQLIASGNVSTEQVEKMMELQERWERNEARKAYNKAMTVFRGTVGMAHKSAKNDHLRTTYATFNDLVRAVSGPLGLAGFNYTFTQSQEGSSVTVSCTITHSDGHSESTSLTSAIEGNKGINSLQALGLTVSYLKRYTLAALTGVGTEDSDGEGLSEPQPLPEYSAKRFDENWPKWIDLIETGTKSPAAIANQLIKCYSLTEDQMQSVMSLSSHVKTPEA